MYPKVRLRHRRQMTIGHLKGHLARVKWWDFAHAFRPKKRSSGT
jgi:hypothetical protein